MDEPALLQAILDDPDDLETRRVYGDVLSARGEARGELIQLQCALAELADGDIRRAKLAARASVLIAAHQARWIAPFAKQITSCELRRGMVEYVRAKPNRLFNEDDQLFDREPVLELAVTKLTQLAVAPFAELPLDRVRTLHVGQSNLGDAARTLIASPHLGSLRALDLDRAGIGDGVLAALRDSALATQLESLALGGNQLSPAAIAAFVGGDHPLGTLALAGQLRDISAFAVAFALPKLRSLDLADNQIGNEQLGVLIGNRAIRGLRNLGLADNQLRGHGVGACAAMAQLEVLDLTNNPIGPTSGEAFANMAWPKLRELRLGHTRGVGQGRVRLGDDGIAGLVRARFPALVMLDVRDHEIGTRGVGLLAAVTWPLEALDLSANRIGEAVQALVDAGFARTLRRLRLSRCQLSTRGLLALAGGAWPRLESLDLAGERAEPEAFTALAGANMPQLVELDLSGSNAPRSVVRTLTRRLGAGLRT